jgi:hypothetical protein
LTEGGLAVDTKMEFVAGPATFRFTFLGAHGRHLALNIGYGHATLLTYLQKLGTFATRSGHRYFGSARNPREYCLANFTDTRFFYSVDTWPGASHPGTAGCDEVDASIDAVQPPT